MKPQSEFAVPNSIHPEEAKAKGSNDYFINRAAYAPLPWKNYFDSLEMLDDVFYINYHQKKKIPLYMAGSKGPIILCLHGAGYSGLSFALFARELRPYYRIAAFDFRGHGISKVPDESDYSLNTLVKDTITVIRYLTKKYENVNIVIVGHSMGGAIATRTVKELYDKKDQYPFYLMIKALSVIDVVEGSAINALQYMDAIIDSKPKQFKAVEDAVHWTIISGNIKVTESARVSIPCTLVETPPKNELSSPEFKWRTDLTKTRPYWEEWFKGLSKDFIGAKVVKQLVLAGADRMDTELCIGHMQGKFKLDIISGVGHMIQEDNPKALALTIATFLNAFKINGDDSKKTGFKMPKLY